MATNTYSHKGEIRLLQNICPEIHLVEEINFKDWKDQNKIIFEYGSLYQVTAERAFKVLTGIREIE